MVNKRHSENIQIFKDLGSEDQKYWLDFKQKKFLHNIDTFYYSVKFEHDFTKDTKDVKVLKLRRFFNDAYERMEKQEEFNGCYQIFFPTIQESLNLRPFSFAHYFSICLECPDWFDVFIAPSVPKGSDGGESVTCEIVVQIRSYMLWIYGVNEAYERSFEYIKGIADYFGLQIAFTQENRIDYCWHTNYIQNPEKYFRPDNFYKMRVDRFKDAMFHTAKNGLDGYEIDYISMGKRSEKVFIRIYLKTKEVIEKGYKPWFFKCWLLNGLINRYDFYVYEECFKKQSWHYVDTARIKFYSEYGTYEPYREKCFKILNGIYEISENELSKFADMLTPKINLIMNVEYQTMRKHSKSYQLVPFRDNSSKEISKRIYDYFDNRQIIADYLTHSVFRLTDINDDNQKKSRREYSPFWKALRQCKMIDVKPTPKQIKLIRNYTRKLNSEILKKKAINSAVTLGIYQRGINNDNPIQDLVEALCRLNDNDIQDALRFKTKKIRQFNRDELSNTYESSETHDYELLSRSTGELITNLNTIY